jgi:broad specificity phosphatase PhoE
MLQLTLIRHGLTDWNTSRRFQGHSDVPLSAEGRRQAEELAQRLKKARSIDAVYCSPLARAAETAKIAFPKRDVLFDDRLKEINFGLFEGKTVDENLAHPEWPGWFEDPFGRPTPGGESYRDLRERVVAWYKELPSEGHFAAMTHSGVVQMLLAHFLGIAYPRWRKRIFIGHTSLTRVLFDKGDCVIERVNDTRHLSGEESDPFF